MKEHGEAPRVMPLEALWWVDDPAGGDPFAAADEGRVTVVDPPRRQLMIMQPDRIGPQAISAARTEAKRRKPSGALDRLRYERWTEGLSAQLLHVGPCAAEGVSIARLRDREHR